MGSTRGYQTCTTRRQRLWAIAGRSRLELSRFASSAFLSGRLASCETSISRDGWRLTVAPPSFRRYEAVRGWAVRNRNRSAGQSSCLASLALCSAIVWTIPTLSHRRIRTWCSRSVSSRSEPSASGRNVRAFLYLELAMLRLRLDRRARYPSQPGTSPRSTLALSSGIYTLESD